jgi:ParB family chromosome partitioning protein
MTTIHSLPVDKINVPNPRSRNETVFKSIVDSIRGLGLKRPITVTQRAPAPDGTEYDLVCGEGRLKAFKALGQTTIPSIIIGVDPAERILMGLVENVARRRPSNMELLREITSLKARGYTSEQIAAKLNFDPAYIYGITHLLQHGDEGLINHVEQRRIPLSVAVKIATGTDHEVQQALCEAYENGDLRGHRLTEARRIIAERLAKTKGRTDNKRAKLSGETLVREYHRHIARQHQLMRKAELTRDRLLLLSSVFKRLFADEQFVTLLRAERLESVPECLAHRVQ